MGVSTGGNNLGGRWGGRRAKKKQKRADNPCSEVPIVVGRCGAYLKGKTDIEGIFRVSGSAKRMRDLQAIFDEGPTVSLLQDHIQCPPTDHQLIPYTSLDRA
jgi:hypothetical protein